MKTIVFISFTLAALLAGAQAAAPPASPGSDDLQDVLYLGEGRPALLRLHLRIDGHPVQVRWDAFTRRLFHHLDRNGNGTLDAAEAARLPAPVLLPYLFQGNVYSIVGRRGNAAPFASVDSDASGTVTLDELRAWLLTNNAGPLAQTAVGGVGMADALTETLFQRIDTDGNGKLSAAEQDAAATLLARLDSNDDELLSAVELGGGTYPYQVRAPVDTRRVLASRTASPGHLVLLPREEGRRSVKRMAVLRDWLMRLDRDRDGRLSREESSFPADVFTAIDRNRDGGIDPLELGRWTRRPPDASFTVPLSLPATMVQGGAGRLSPPRELGPPLALGSVQLTVVAAPGYPQADLSRQLLEQFRQATVMTKGVLARKQLTPQHYLLNSIFEWADRDGDSRLTEADLVALLELMQAGSGARATLILTSTGQGLFQRLDGNGDGQLSLRELRAVRGRLASHDRNGDGDLGRDELPQQFRLSVGTSPYAGAYGGTVVPTLRTPGHGPVWFRKADTNGDGDLSPREWLGTAADFTALDTDGDGLISAAEAESADRRLRGTGK